MSSRGTTSESSERSSSSEGLVLLRWPFALFLMSAAMALGLRLASRRAGIPFRWRVESPTTLALTLLVALVLPVCIAALRGAARGAREGSPPVRVVGLPQYAAEVILIVAAAFFTRLASVNLARQIGTWNPDLFDSPLWRLDSALGLGPAPVGDFSAIVDKLGLLPAVDLVGPVLWSLTPLAIAWVWVRRDLATQRWRVGLAALFVVVGAAGVQAAWPTLGPAAYRSSQFLWLDHAPLTRLTVESGLRAAAELRQNPWAAVERSFDGLLAGPDVAVAVLVVVVGAASGWRTVQGRVGIVCAAFCGAVALALGRHYLIDELTGVALGLGAWSLARSIVPTAEDPVP